MAHAGIIGANGAGKSTLFRMLVGQEEPDSGQLKIGETVQTMYVDQSREALQSDRSATCCPGEELVFLPIKNQQGRVIVEQFEMSYTASSMRHGVVLHVT